MNEVIQSLLALANDIKEVKACLQTMKQTRAEKFKELYPYLQKVGFKAA